MCANSLQLCPTLCNSMDCRLPGSSVHRILQARILEWVAIPSSRQSSRLRNQTHISYVSCLGTHIHICNISYIICVTDIVPYIIPYSIYSVYNHFAVHLKLTQHCNQLLIGKDCDAGRDWGQEEKGTTEDEMAGWHPWLDRRESQWTLGVGDGQGGLACCDSWGHKESDTTEQLIWSCC